MIGLSVVNSSSKSAFGQAVRMLAGRLESHQIDDVDDANLQVGQFAAENIDGGQRFDRRHVAAAGHHHVGLAAAVVAGPFPDADAGGAVLDRRVHVEPLVLGLLAGDDHVDVVAAAEAVVGHAQQRVGVGRQVDANHLGLLIRPRGR